jgi:hypothetical protein
MEGAELEVRAAGDEDAGAGERGAEVGAGGGEVLDPGDAKPAVGEGG